MDDLWSQVATKNFSYRPRNQRFDWKLLHGIDIDEVVRLHDVGTLEDVIDTLLSGTIDAEAELSSHNYGQLFKLIQLSVEHLWQLRPIQAKLYEVQLAAVDAAFSWKRAASTYLEAAGGLLGTAAAATHGMPVLPSDMLAEVANAREVLEAADEAWNQLLRDMEAVEASVGRCRLRRHHQELNWRALFSADLQQLVVDGDPSGIEPLLPLVVHGSLGTEDPSSLTPLHYQQLVRVGQACLDALWEGGKAASEQLSQVKLQLRSESTLIPELTTQVALVKDQVWQLLRSTVARGRSPSPSMGPNPSMGVVGGWRPSSPPVVGTTGPRGGDRMHTTGPGSPLGYASGYSGYPSRPVTAAAATAGGTATGHPANSSRYASMGAAGTRLSGEEEELLETMEPGTLLYEETQQVGVSALRSAGRSAGGATQWLSDAGTGRGSQLGSSMGGGGSGSPVWTAHMMRNQQELLGVSAGLAELEEAARMERQQNDVLREQLAKMAGLMSQVMHSTPSDDQGAPQVPLDSTLMSTGVGQSTMGTTGGKGAADVVSSVDATGKMHIWIKAHSPKKERPASPTRTLLEQQLALMAQEHEQVRSAMRQSWVESAAAAAAAAAARDSSLPGLQRHPARAAGKAAPLLSCDGMGYGGQPLRASRGSREVSPAAAGGRQGRGMDRPTLPLMMSSGSGLRSMDSSLGPLTMGLLASPTMRSGRNSPLAVSRSQTPVEA